jgi:hypothetical protein
MNAEDWYVEFIEFPIRKVVRLLRNHGVNTECSCGHQMYVQFQVIDGSDVDRVDTVLSDHRYRDYIIECHVNRAGGHLQAYGTVYFKVGGKYPVHAERTAALEQFIIRKVAARKEAQAREAAPVAHS